MMKTLLLSMAATVALAASVTPAAAQPWNGRGDYGRHQNYGGEHRLTTPYVDSLVYKITTAACEGRISWGEARSLRDQVRSVHDIAWRVQTGEARRGEVARLDAVVTRVEQAVNGGRYARGYGERRYDDRRYDDRSRDDRRYDDGPWRR